MPVGDTICASRNGVVVGIVNQNKKGGRSKRFLHYVNYITLYHNDGSFSAYNHIAYKGNLVKMGERVISGQPIALSGNTGRSTTPHLHFVTFEAVNYSTKTFPIKFKEIIW